MMLAHIGIHTGVSTGDLASLMLGWRDEHMVFMAYYEQEMTAMSLPLINFFNISFTSIAFV